MDEIKYRPIGVIHSPFKEPPGTPIQPADAIRDELKEKGIILEDTPKGTVWYPSG